MKNIIRILSIAFYPLAIVIAFRAYAFEETGKLFALLVVMTLIAALYDWCERMEKRKAAAYQRLIGFLKADIELNSNRGDES